MHDPEKSDSGIVATKPTNKAGRPAAEPVEPRPGTKGNADQQSTHRTQSRVRVTQALDRVRQAAPTCALTSNTRGRSRMPKSGLSGSVRGAPSNGRPYRDTPRKPRKGRCAGQTRLQFRGRLIRLGETERRRRPVRCTGVLAAARTQGKRAQHGKPQSAVRDDQPDAREGEAGHCGVAERLVVCAGQRVSSAGGLKSPRRSDEERRIRKRGDARGAKEPCCL